MKDRSRGAGRMRPGPENQIGIGINEMKSCMRISSQFGKTLKLIAGRMDRFGGGRGQRQCQPGSKREPESWNRAVKRTLWWSDLRGVS